MKLWPFGNKQQQQAPAAPTAAPEIKAHFDERGFSNFGGCYWPEHVHWQTYDRYHCGPHGRDLAGIAWACVNIISQDISTLRPQVGLTQEDGSFRTLPSSQLQQLLDVPNGYMTGLDFIAYNVAALLTTGNMFVYTPRSMTGDVTAMHPLHPDTCRPYIKDGRLVWQIVHIDCNLIPELRGRDYLTDREVLHVPYMLCGNPVIGVSPISASALSLAQNHAINTNSANFFGNSSQPSGIITGPEKIGNDLAKRIKEHWEANFNGANFGRTAVLGSSLEWKPITITAVDAQLIEQLRYTVENIAACFRLPLFMLSDLSKATFRNSEAQQRAYYNLCLRPIIEKLEAAFNAHFGFAKEVQPRSVRFNLEGLLRTDSDTRFANYAKGISAGFLTINEARRAESLPPIEGGDEPLVQVQYQPLSAINAGNNLSAAVEVIAPIDAATIDEDVLSGELEKQLAGLRVKYG